MADDQYAVDDQGGAHVAVEEQAVAFVEDGAAQAIAMPASGRLAELFDRDGRVSLEALAAWLGWTKTQLAESIGVPRDTVYRSDRAAAPKTQARALETLEIVHRIIPWAGGERQAAAWYRAEPLPAFGGRTAEHLVRDGKAVAVRDYLDHVATGGFA